LNRVERDIPKYLAENCPSNRTKLPGFEDGFLRWKAATSLQSIGLAACISLQLTGSRKIHHTKP